MIHADRSNNKKQQQKVKIKSKKEKNKKKEAEMAGAADIFRQIGDIFKGKPKTANKTADQQQGRQGMPIPPQKGFDFNIYMQAVQIFFKDFFTRQVPEFFKDPVNKLRNFLPWWKKQKQDEQIAFGGVLAGFIMIISAVIWIIVA